MAQDTSEKLLFEIRLDAEQLKQQQDAVRRQQQQLTIDIAETRKQQKLLEADYKAGSVTAGEYGIEAQRLSERLRTQTKEQAAAGKTLDNLSKFQDSATDSNNQLRAELALTTAAYNTLGKAERENSEEGKALQARTKAISDELKKNEGAVGDNRRNVGNYSGSLQDLVKEMVKLQVQEKSLAAGSQELAENQQRQIGFQTAASAAAAKAGKTYEQAQKEISNYAKAITPAVTNLVALEEEQARIVDTAGETSEAYQQIGFKIAAASKELDEAAAPTQSFKDALLDAAKGSDSLGGAVDQATGLQEKFTQAQGLAKLALGGTATASSVLRVAMLAIPIFALVAGLTALFAFLTKTQAGADFVAKKFGAVKAIFSVLSNVVVDFGGKLFAAIENPKQGLTDLVDFLETNLMNRLKSFGVILDAIINRDFTKFQDGIIQATTGIADGTAKLKGFGDELGKAASEGERLAAAQRQLNRDTDDNIDTNKRLLNEVERLKNVRDNEFNSLAVRKKANEDAFRIDLLREKTLADLAARRVEILKGEIALAGGRDKVSREQFQELKEAENELSDIREDSAGKQNELITTRFQLNKEGLDKLAELAEKAAAAEQKRIKDRIGLEQAELDNRLRTVASGSEQELSLLRAKLASQRELELSEAQLSADRKKAIETKYRSDVEQLERDHLQKLRVLAAQDQQTAIAAQLAAAREGSQEEFLLKAQAIEAQLLNSLAGIDRQQSAERQAAEEARLRAETARQQAELEFGQALANLDAYLIQERTRLNQQYADGQLTKAQYEASLQAIEFAGQQARLVTLQDYGRDTTTEEEKISQQSVAVADKAKDEKKRIADAEAEIKLAVVSTAQDAANTVIGLLGEETGAGQAALVIKKALSLAQIAINLQLELSAIAAAAAANPLNVPTAGVAGISQTAVLSGIAIARAALAAAKVLAFADGGLVTGPGTGKSDSILARLSNGEAVMTAEAVRLFGPLLSMMNVAGGGRSFYQDPMSRGRLTALADGGVVRYNPAVMEPLRSGTSGGSSIDYRQLATAIAEEVGPVFFAANAALPTPSVSVVEFSRVQNKVSTNERNGDL